VIPYRDHILPMSETPLNKALASLSTRIEGIDAPTRQVWSPWDCPPQFLKSLAHALSVDLWDDAWTDLRKRSIIANAIRLHRAKGTLEAARSYLRYVDARLLAVLTPPQAVYSGPSLTRSEREAWLSKLPQVRTWRVRESGTRGFGFYTGGFGFSSFFEIGFPIPSTAFKRLNRRARWVVGDTETDTRVSDFGSYFRLHIKGAAGERVFSGLPSNGGQFFQPSSAAQRIVTIAPAARMPWRSPVGPQFEAVTSEPERVKVAGEVDRGVFCGLFVRGGFFRPTSAPLRIFWRFAVSDESHVSRRPSIQFMGVGRYGFPAHTAHLQVSMPGKRPVWAAGEGIVASRRRFWLPHDASRVLNVRRALIASKRASDNILIRYPARPQIIAGQLFRAGIDTFIVGRPAA